MPSRNIHLTKEWDQFVAEQVEAGQYANASEVVRAGLSALKNSEETRKAKLEALRSAVLHGINSGVAEGDVMAEARELVRRRAAENASKERISA
jgi:antitoxin ParD1/3/4